MRDLTNLYLSIAEQIAAESRAERLKVGALIVFDDNIVAYGYNGTPSGFENECEVKNEWGETVTKPEVLHAESNAIAKCARSVHSSEGATLYTTHSPCFDCCKLIIQAGIVRVIYLENYRVSEGLELLTKAGVDHYKHT